MAEFVREEIRATHYDSLPSRLNCCFSCENEIDAILFRDEHRRDWSVYSVRLTDNEAVSHRVCYTIALPAIDEQDHIRQQFAHEYWSAPAVYSSRTEIFAESDLVIVAKIC
jgi:hypothetical protein